MAATSSPPDGHATTCASPHRRQDLHNLILGDIDLTGDEPDSRAVEQLLPSSPAEPPNSPTPPWPSTHRADRTPTDTTIARRAAILGGPTTSPSASAPTSTSSNPPTRSCASCSVRVRLGPLVLHILRSWSSRRCGRCGLRVTADP